MSLNKKTIPMMAAIHLRACADTGHDIKRLEIRQHRDGSLKYGLEFGEKLPKETIAELKKVKWARWPGTAPKEGE